MMTREQAIKAYNRVKDWERRQSAELRERIMVPYFGGCGCRMHNCRVNFERGIRESGVKGKSHAELATLSRQYDGLQRLIWDRATRLQAAFARYF